MGGALKSYSNLLNMTGMWRSSGVGEPSIAPPPSEPGRIFSTPSARQHSLSPPSTNCRASSSALEPVAQAFETL